MPLLCDTMIPYHHYTYGAATQTAVLLYTERFFLFFHYTENLCHSLLAFFDSQGAACHVLAF